MNQNTLDQTIDQSLVFGPVINSTDGTIVTAAQTIDLGTGLVNFDIIYRVSNCDIATGDEYYQVNIYGASTAANLAAFTNVSLLSTSYFGSGSMFAATVNKPVGTYIESCNNVTSLGTQTTMEGQVVNYTRFIQMTVSANGTTPTITVQANLVISK